ncbi:MAG TPA: acetate kinase [Clostridia bacterium]|nr:acetate kinase [Clostridia bacterium]
MKVLVVNAGSSSLKYQLMETDTGDVIAKGICERIGQDASKTTYKPTGKEPRVFDETLKDHTDAIKLVLNALIDPEIGVIKSMKEIDAVGHRIVHGGEKFKSSALIDDCFIEAVEKLSELAPLHNPANLMGVRACKAVMPNVPMVGVFDTAFHQTMPATAFMYGLPYEAYSEHLIRRYGFHGTSHYFVSQKAVQKLAALGIKPEDSKVITCHLGNGSSIAAVKGGKSIDTSMGFTPLEGVPMGTRSGSIDPAIVFYLMDKLDLDCNGVSAYLNKKSGMQGISGLSSDFRDLDEASKEGNERAKLAVDMFAYAVKKYVGAYAAAMNGVDAIVFTAGVGEHDGAVRERVLQGLDYLGVDVDCEFNRNFPRGAEAELSTPKSKVKVYVIPTDEELMIARDTAAIIQADK